MTELKRVCVIGSGSWGKIIAKLIGTNVKGLESFNDEVTWFDYEGTLVGRQSMQLFDDLDDKTKCLPENVVVIPDIVEAAKEAHIIVFVIPQTFILSICTSLFGKIKPTAAGLCLIRGFESKEDGNIGLISHFVTRHLKIQTSVLMGTTLYEEVADGMFCELTIGCKDKGLGVTLTDLFQTEYIRVTVLEDIDAAEVCGCLRNIVACGTGIVEGLGLGRNAKATVIRLGLIEMIKFVDIFFPGSKLSTFFESCGVSDLVTAFQSGYNHRISVAFVKFGESIEELEVKMLNGTKAEGPLTAQKINYMLHYRDMEGRFPLFTAVHRVFVGELKPESFLQSVQRNSEHTNVRLLHLTW